MAIHEPPGALPRYPAPDETYAAPPSSGGPTAPTSVNTGAIWGIAMSAGAVVYVCLLVIHLSVSTYGSAAYRAGEMMPIAGLSAVAVAVVARATSTTKAWSWWAISLAVVAASALWYTVVEVLPRAADDARAKVTGQTARRLVAPQRAGAWTRLEGAAAQQHERQILAQVDEVYGDMRAEMTVTYGEYGNGNARLLFLGLNPSGDLAVGLSASPSSTLRSFMAGNGAKHPELVDAGDLGGYMACSGEAPVLLPGQVYCAWADGSTVGRVILDQPGLDTKHAAAVTRAFRSHATQR